MTESLVHLKKEYDNIIEVIAPANKLYYFRMDNGKEVFTSKGIRKDFFQKHNINI